MSTARRAFVTVGDRQVHYRRAGSGPPLVCLHESPRSSAALERLVHRLCDRFTVIALDTPGYGLSDPLESDAPEIGDYARAAAETLDALGIDRYGVYGRHTGACIALELAYRHPDRVAHAFLDGLPLYTDTETNELLERYAPWFAPTDDGSHLAALWTCYRDRFVFSPWFRRERSARRDVPMPDEDELHAGVMDILRAGPRYPLGYHAAFRYRPATAVSQLTVPATISAAPGDVLANQLDRLPELPSGVAVSTEDARRLSLDEAVTAAMARDLAGLPTPAPRPTAPVPGRIWRDYADTGYGQLLVRRAGDDRPGAPLVMLHASPGSAEMLVGLIRRLGLGRPVLALDTLGNGDSDKPEWDSAAIEDYAPVVEEATEALGLERFDLYGSHTGALIALETALLVPERVRRLVLDGVALFTPAERDDLLEHYTPPLRPSPFGTHLLFAWNLLRDQTLFWPWYNRTPAGVRRVDPIGPEQLHRWCVELLKSGHTYPIAYRAAFSHDTRSRVPALRTPTLMAARATDMLHESTFAAAALAGDTTSATLPETDEETAVVIASFLDGSADDP